MEEVWVTRTTESTLTGFLSIIPKCRIMLEVNRARKPLVLLDILLTTMRKTDYDNKLLLNNYPIVNGNKVMYTSKDGSCQAIFYTKLKNALECDKTGIGIVTIRTLGLPNYDLGSSYQDD